MTVAGRDTHSPVTGSGATRTGSRLVQLFEFDMLNMVIIEPVETRSFEGRN